MRVVRVLCHILHGNVSWKSKLIVVDTITIVRAIWRIPNLHGML